MQLKNSADIFSSDGKKVGSLDRVVMNPETKEVTHIVVEKGILLKTNKVIPIEYVNLEEEDRITLEKNAEELEVLPSYDPDSYLTLDKTAYPDQDQGLESVYWYPPLHSTWWTSSGGSLRGYAKPRFVKAESVIPEDTIALKEGAKVISKDGKHIGNVEQVIVDTSEHLATHVVLSAGFFLRERKLVPTFWIADVDEDKITLSVHSDLFEQLPEYESVT